MKLNIIKNRFRIDLDKKLKKISALVDAGLGHWEGFVNIVFANDKLIRALNKQYRKKDKITDLLTFTYAGENGGQDYLLGEIMICIPQARRQSKEFAVTFENEMYKLFIHGMLHLRGYDHEKDPDFRVMKLLEDKIMKSLTGSKKI